MSIVIGIIKFLASFIAIGSTLLYLRAYLKSLESAKQLFGAKEDKEVYESMVRHRIRLGIIMAVTWSLVIVL